MDMPAIKCFFQKQTKIRTLICTGLFIAQACNSISVEENYCRIESPPRDVTFKQLRDNNFTISGGEGVDVPILQRQIADTLFYYQFGSATDTSRPISMSKEYILDKKDSALFVFSQSIGGYGLVCERQEGLYKTLLIKTSNNLYYSYSFMPVDSSKLKVNLHFGYPIF